MNCRVCSEAVQQFLDLGETPLADRFPKTKDEEEIKFPLKVCVCPRCFLVQLDSPVLPQDMFDDDYGFFTGASPGAVSHFNGFAQTLLDKHPQKHSVVEIASNDGTLLGFFKNAGKWVLGIEPTPNTAKRAIDSGIQTEVNFFDSAYAKSIVEQYGRSDVVIANNVLAHVPSPRDFLLGMRHLVKDDGIVVVEVHHALNLITKAQFDNFYHEHYSYYLSEPLDVIFEMADLFIYDVEKVDTQGGSLRVYATPGDNYEGSSQAWHDLYEEETDLNLYDLDIYEGMQEQVDQVKTDLISLLKSLDGKRIYAYGASAKSNTLLNFCNVGEYLEYMVDMTPEKYGRFTPGTKIPIISPTQELVIGKPDYYLLTVWNYLDGVLAREQEFRDNGGKFIIPGPTPYII